VFGEEPAFLSDPEYGRARAHRGLTDADFGRGGFADFLDWLGGVQRLVAAKHE
jgi:hypothetical protein